MARLRGERFCFTHSPRTAAQRRVARRQGGRATRLDFDAEGALLFTAPASAGDAALQRALRDFYSDFFDQPPHANEAKALSRETAAGFAKSIAA